MRSPYSGKLIPSKRELPWLHEGGVCHWCNKPTRYAKGNASDVATIDHVIPRYKQGTNDKSNLVSACNLCNRRRSYEDQMGLLDGSLLGHYPVPRRRRIHRKAAMLRHAINIPLKGEQQVSKSIFDSDRAWYTRTQSGSDLSYSFEIEEMSDEERKLLAEAETILFKLATSVTQKTSTVLKETPKKPHAKDEIESLKATVVELQKTVEGIAELRKQTERLKDDTREG